MSVAYASRPYVISAKITDTHQITFRVDVGNFAQTDPQYRGGGVEISGQATQDGGAFANIHAIKRVPTEPNGGPGVYYIDVTVDTIPPNQFRKDQDVAIFVRVSKAWVTVLGQLNPPPAASSDQTADVGTTWDQVKEVSQLDGTLWPPSQTAGSG